MKNNKLFVFLLSLLVILAIIKTPVYASSPTDEITNYTITVDVNDDATLNIYYHIEWLVLEDSIGPLEWVKIGIPNRHTVRYEALSDSIKKISTMSSNGYYMRIDLEHMYFEGETAVFDFMIVQDNMYQVNKIDEGYTVYSFTPGWFDDIAVDDLTIKWKMDNSTGWTPDCNIEDGYLVWNTSLRPGQKYTVTSTYSNDAYAFNLNQSSNESDTSIIDIIVPVIEMIISFACMLVPIVICIVVMRSIRKYANGANFGGTKKITRTRVEYYPSCPGCGAVRKEGEKFCSYCGRSMVKSEEVIKEEDIKGDDKYILNLDKDGEFRYAKSPNTYIRVHSVVIPRSTPTRSRSSCAHSSCAHSSCACACACACAGGGRAGCTNKDFYKTNLKLKQLERKLKEGKRG